jgi:hypothetical protein
MKTLLFFCLLGTSVPALATTPAEPLITRTSITEMHLCVTLANLQQQRTFVWVRRLDDGEVYFREVVRKDNGHQTTLDLSRIPDGRYVVEVKKGDTLRRQIVLKKADGLLCSGWQ